VGDSQMSMSAAHAATMEPTPFGMTSKKLVMWLFIIADAATFGAMLFAYGYTRASAVEWPRPFAFFPSIVNAMVMTVVLLTSSLTMLQAVSAARRDDRAGTAKWMWITIGLGTLFAGLHLREWFNMFKEGWSLSANPTGGTVQFGAAFFSITGLHLAHVISGVVALAVIAMMFKKGRLTAGHIETTGLYWHFVDLVWMFVFPLMYLLNAH
jgi:cytochrome c oxidase subunit 3